MICECPYCRLRREARAAAVLLLAALVAVVWLACGCTSTYVTYDTPAGAKLSLHRRSCLTRAEIPAVEFGTNGTVRMSDYKSDGGNEAISSITRAAVKGAVEAATGK